MQARDTAFYQAAHPYRMAMACHTTVDVHVVAASSSKLPHQCVNSNLHPKFPRGILIFTSFSQETTSVAKVPLREPASFFIILGNFLKTAT
jgi:hypothetical protein